MIIRAVAQGRRLLASYMLVSINPAATQQLSLASDVETLLVRLSPQEANLRSESAPRPSPSLCKQANAPMRYKLQYSKLLRVRSKLSERKQVSKQASAPTIHTCNRELLRW